MVNLDMLMGGAIKSSTFLGSDYRLKAEMGGEGSFEGIQVVQESEHLGAMGWSKCKMAVLGFDEELVGLELLDESLELRLELVMPVELLAELPQTRDRR